MRLRDSSTPVLVLQCRLGGLAVMRSLGSLGVSVYGVDGNGKAPGMLSRYCRGRFIEGFDEDWPHKYLGRLLEIGGRLKRRAVLIPTTDELAVFVAENARQLGDYYVFPENDPALVGDLISKEGMHRLANAHGVPTPVTVFPRTLEDVLAYVEGGRFPVMLKGIHGNRLQARTGKKMVIVHSGEELVANYRELEDPDQPNLMLQEYIPGGDDQIHIFNGYFDADSECLAAFTGRKIRQYPIHVGCASLGECSWNEEVADITVRFMKAIGYRGILDIGYRYDARDGSYKVLDINPRMGQAFRMFVDEDGNDVVRTLYGDLTGSQVRVSARREGRRWLIEDYDLESAIDYYREGTLSMGRWVKSFRGLQEAAWFNPRDPLPFLAMCLNLAKRALKRTARVPRFLKKLNGTAKVAKS